MMRLGSFWVVVAGLSGAQEAPFMQGQPAAHAWHVAEAVLAPDAASSPSATTGNNVGPSATGGQEKPPAIVPPVKRVMPKSPSPPPSPPNQAGVEKAKPSKR